jgi:hypothetical protein
MAGTAFELNKERTCCFVPGICILRSIQLSAPFRPAVAERGTVTRRRQAECWFLQNPAINIINKAIPVIIYTICSHFSGFYQHLLQDLRGIHSLHQ